MKERWHKRSERNPKLAKAVKAAKDYHGTTCMVYGFNFEQTYGEIAWATSKPTT